MKVKVSPPLGKVAGGVVPGSAWRGRVGTSIVSDTVSPTETRTVEKARSRLRNSLPDATDRILTLESFQGLVGRVPFGVGPPPPAPSSFRLLRTLSDGDREVAVTGSDLWRCREERSRFTDGPCL